MDPDLSNRRPLKSRSSALVARLAKRLADARTTPNTISATAVGFAAMGFGFLLASGMAFGFWRGVLLVAAALTIQLRLLCNLLDGLVAVEHGKASRTGPIWNELPDRLADGFFLVGAGYGAWTAGVDLGQPLGWLCAFLAVLTAYIRELGRGLGQPADFTGPLAKPQRMALLTAACLVAAIEPLWHWRGECLLLGLILIAVGTAITAWRRTARLANALQTGARS